MGGRVQVHEETLCGSSRPCAPAECVRCRGAQKLHSKGAYQRYSGCSGKRQVRVLRFECPRCGITIGVIPRGMFPYRSLPVERFEHWMDAQSGLPAPMTPIAGGSARPPPATEVERGSLQRARQRLLQRIPGLCGLLGQRIPSLGCSGITGFWQALRLIGSTMAILLDLARNFKASLLGDYLSLSANWQRAAAPD